MAFATGMNATQVQLGYGAATTFQRLVAQFNTYRLYRKTVNELQGLSNRDLADLGLSRSGITATAREAVYGS